MNMRVVDLIDHANNSWNVELIRNTFNEDDCGRILAISLPSEFKEDGRFWWPTKSSNYTVKSGYWLVRLGRSVTASNGEDETIFWRQIWRTKGPPKLCHFLWSKESLDVRGTLEKRHIIENATRELCEREEESVVHAIFNCPCISGIWEQCQWAEVINNAPVSSFKERWKWLMLQLGGLTMSKGCTLAWVAWFCQNKAVFESPVQNVFYTAARFLRLVEEYNSYVEMVFGSSNTSTHTTPCSWYPPPCEMIKVNTDAHVVEGVRASLGAVLRDHNGSLMAVVLKAIEPTRIDVVEAEAARFGTQLARRLGFNKVIVECDAVNIVKAVKEQKFGFSPI